MELNLIGALTMFKTMDMVPNFSELARTFGRDRHTIKKMYEGKGRKRRKKRASELDAHVEEMTALLSRPGTSVKAAYWFLKNERGIKCSYDNFKRFARAKGISERAKAAVPHPLYETDPGQQLQVCTSQEKVDRALSIFLNPPSYSAAAACPSFLAPSQLP